jgi:Domain of unknown function (DUF4395)
VGVRRLFTFPNPVNEHAARTVAAGVVVQCLLYLATGWRWLLVPLALGFVARVLAGPRFSPLGRLATQVIVPALGRTPRLVPGPPKRFAQSIGATLSAFAVVSAFAGNRTLAVVAVAGITVAAVLESAFAVCLGCILFRRLMRAGVIPESVCADCADISGRLLDAVAARTVTGVASS